MYYPSYSNPRDSSTVDSSPVASNTTDNNPTDSNSIHSNPIDSNLECIVSLIFMVSLFI